MSGTIGPNIVTDGLVLYLNAGDTNSYSGSGTTFTDLSRSSNNGTLTNGPTFNSGNLGSIVLDGGSDYISMNSTPITTAFTINIWVQKVANGLSGATNFTVLCDRINGITPASGNRNGFFLNGNTVLYFTARVSNVSLDAISNSFTSVLNRICMCSVTYDGSVIKFYVNGASVLSTPYALVGPLDNGTSPTFIGRSTASADYFLNGNVYNYQLYNIGLSDSQILQNYNALKRRFGL